jgi:transposase
VGHSVDQIARRQLISFVATVNVVKRRLDTNGIKQTDGYRRNRRIE